MDTPPFELAFAPQFVAKVATGNKFITHRTPREVKPNPGDPVILYAAYDEAKTPLVDDAIITHAIVEVEITREGLSVLIDGRRYGEWIGENHRCFLDQYAAKAGHYNWTAFVDYHLPKGSDSVVKWEIIWDSWRRVRYTALAHQLKNPTNQCHSK